VAAQAVSCELVSAAETPRSARKVRGNRARGRSGCRTRPRCGSPRPPE
jgi:hypothetical protein